MIKVIDLVKNYGTFNILKKLNLTIRSGEVLGLLGPNGSGKTSFMNILTGILPYEGGDVYVEDMDLTDYAHMRKLKTLIGYLPENCPLYEDMYVEEFLSYMAELRNVKKEDLKERVDVVLNAVGIEERRFQRIAHLSKGYKQRVGIAQALIHNPKILILDEPTTGLDPAQMKEIRDLINNLKEDRTIILSTHLLTEVSQICDRIVIISKGEIKKEGKESEIIQGLSSDYIEIYITHDNPELTKILKSVDAVNSVKIDYRNQERNNGFIITLDYSGKDPSYDIIKQLVKNNIVFTEIRKKKLSLEEVFIKIIDK